MFEYINFVTWFILCLVLLLSSISFGSIIYDINFTFIFKPLMLKNGSKILKTKWEGELAVKEEFPEATIIRPSVVYGHGDNFMHHYMHKERSIYKYV